MCGHIHQTRSGRGLLNSGTTDILDQMVLCWEGRQGCPKSWSMVTNILGLYPLYANNTCPLPTPQEEYTLNGLNGYSGQTKGIIWGRTKSTFTLSVMLNKFTSRTCVFTALTLKSIRNVKTININYLYHESTDGICCFDNLAINIDLEN